MKEANQRKTMRKGLVLIGVIIGLAMLSGSVMAITDTSYYYNLSLDAECGNFDCADPLDYWETFGSGVGGDASAPTLTATNCRSGNCYDFFSNAGDLSTSVLSSHESVGAWRAYYVGENTTIDYWANFSGNYTGGGFLRLDLYDVPSGAPLYTLDTITSSDHTNTTWTLRRWINEENSSVPYGFYWVQFSHSGATNRSFVDDVEIYGTQAETYNLNVIVHSATEYENETGTSCPLNIVDATVSFANETQTNATLDLDNCCYYQGTEYGCRAYNFTGINEGTHTLTVEKTGYRTAEYDILLEYDMGTNVWLEKPTDNTLTLTVTNSTGDSPLARRTLFYGNGSQYPSTTPWDTNPVFTSGINRWLQIPKENYYYIIEADGYDRYLSPIFYLGDDKEFTAVLSVTDRTILLAASSLTGTTADTFNFSITMTGFLLPEYDAHYWIKTEIDELQYKIHIRESPQNFSIVAKDYFEKGTNTVWVVTADGYMSNTIDIEITEDVYTDPSVIGAPLIDMPFGMQWVGLIFSPFFLITMTLVGIGAMLESQVQGSKGVIFLAVMLVGVLAFTYLGLYPAWVGILIVIICGLILSKAMTRGDK